jgi:hypothetical protein
MGQIGVCISVFSGWGGREGRHRRGGAGWCLATAWATLPPDAFSLSSLEALILAQVSEETVVEKANLLVIL